jgi:hypothetical protein
MNTEIFTPEEAKHHHHVQALLDEMIQITPICGAHTDFGCGDGWYVDGMNAAGFDSFGVEGSRIPNTLSNPDRFLQWDLRYPLWLNRRGVVSCIEVMEHIHHEHHDTVMDTLSRHCAGTLLLTWAVPGQGGTRHVSERTQEQVVPYVAQWGFSFNEAESMRMRQWVGAECGYMKNTIYLFQR